MNTTQKRQPNRILKDYRLKARLSRTQLAEMADVNQATIKSAEAGNRVQDVKAYAIAEALSKALNLSLTYEDLHIETF